MSQTSRQSSSARSGHGHGARLPEVVIANSRPEKAPGKTRSFTLPRAVRTVVAVALLSASAGCEAAEYAPPAHARPGSGVGPEVIVFWSDTAYRALVAHDKYANPLGATRLLAMMHLAQHDAVAAVHPRYRSYALDRRRPGADPKVAAAAAAHAVLSAALPGQRALLDAALDESLRSAGGAAGSRRARGLQLGAEAAAAIQRLRADDRLAEALAVTYTPRTGPGAFQFVPPLNAVGLPGWALLQPFGLERADQFRSPPPPALASAAYAASFEEVKAFGSKTSAVRTPDQTAYAKFWWEFSDITWNRIARQVAAERDLALPEAARLFALLNVTLADGYIAGWDAKQHHDFWRPTTAIHEAAHDGNDGTDPDPAWESAELVPPVQDYPSTHSVLGRAAAEVLTAVLGDHVAFTVGTTTAAPAGSTRTFSSFRAASAENADSRVRGGLHFRFSCEAGEELGRRIAEHTLGNRLQARAAGAATAAR